MNPSTAPRPIFVPGVGGTPFAFAHQSEVFDDAVFERLPGHAAVDGEPLRSVEAHAEHLLASITQIPRPSVIIGHSLGAAIALRALTIQPDAVDGLVLIAAGAELPISGEAMSRCRDDFDAEVARLADRSFAAPDSTSHAARSEELRAVGQEALVADYEACAGFSIRGEIATIQVPTLVIGASDDSLWGSEMSEELARGLPMAQMVVVEGAGHMVHVERPDAVNLLVAGYLARLELTLGGY